MKNKNFIDSFNNAISGITYTIKNERNMKIHVAAAVLVLVASLFFGLTKVEFLILCITIGAVIVCELINTAVEVLVDIIVDVYHPKAKIVKDVAAGAVLVSAFISMIVGYIIFIDNVSSSLELGIKTLKRAPMHIAIISIIITVIFTLIIKANFKKGTPFHGGMPSGHSAVAVSAATAVALWTDNIKIIILCFIVALLVIQSRLEGKIHTITEAIAGALLGFSVTLLLFGFFSS